MYLRSNNDPQLSILSSLWLLKQSVINPRSKCAYLESPHWSWTPSSPLPWDLAFRLTRFSKYYSSLHYISAIYQTLLPHLHKKTSLHHQNRRQTDTEEQFKGRAVNETRMLVRFQSPPERRKNACKQAFDFAVSKLFQIMLLCLES